MVKDKQHCTMVRIYFFKSLKKNYSIKFSFSLYKLVAKADILYTPQFLQNPSTLDHQNVLVALTITALSLKIYVVDIMTFIINFEYSYVLSFDKT